MDILAIPISTNQIRFVTHLDISSEMVAKVVDTIDKWSK
jgi:threonine aldolase